MQNANNEEPGVLQIVLSSIMMCSVSGTGMCLPRISACLVLWLFLHYVLLEPKIQDIIAHSKSKCFAHSARF